MGELNSEQTIPSKKWTKLRTHFVWTSEMSFRDSTSDSVIAQSESQQQWQAHATHTQPRKTHRDVADSAGTDHRGLLVFMSPLSRLSPLLSCVLTHSGSIIGSLLLRSDMKVPWNVWMRARPTVVRSGTCKKGVCHRKPTWVALPRFLQMAL